MKLVVIGYVCTLSILLLFSYCFVDLNLQLSSNSTYLFLQPFFRSFLYEFRAIAGIVYIGIISVLFILYVALLRLIRENSLSFGQWKRLFIIVITLLFFSFPAFSYDVFNYIATARVAFYWQENPWIVMPIDIPNEPALAYTRAANKVALYGPTWILLTWFPHISGLQQVWVTIFTFKFVILLFYILFLYMLYKKTKSLFQITVFAFNPLVLVEVILGGHNDITMMVLATSSLLLIQQKRFMKKFISILLFLLSVGVKGATIVLFPLFFFDYKKTSIFFYGFIAMFLVFLLTPFREEMYPWYAVWFFSMLVFLPFNSYSFLYKLVIVISFGLLLRHAPYIFMGYYEGLGPLLRFLVMILPVLIFLLLHWKYLLKLPSRLHE